MLATAGGLLTTAAPASAAASCASPVFTRQFFANTAFSGSPKKTDCDSAIDQNWGSGAPAKGLPADRFGVRWSVTRDFGSGGPFAFTAAAQDGIRVYLDGVRKVDLWKNVSSTRKKTVDVTVPKGRHTLRVDFVNWTGKADVTFAYTPRTSASVDKVKPLTPTGASVTYDEATGKAKVSWAKNKEMDLVGYRVHRRLKGTEYGSKPLATTTSTSFTDTTVPKTGQVFYYEVRAYDKAGNTSAGTADQPVTTVDRTPPAAPFVEMDACPADQPYAAPELVTTAANAADIALYELQRRKASSDAWTTVATAAKGAFCDTGTPADGAEVTYRGRARDAAGKLVGVLARRHLHHRRPHPAGPRRRRPRRVPLRRAAPALVPRRGRHRLPGAPVRPGHRRLARRPARAGDHDRHRGRPAPAHGGERHLPVRGARAGRQGQRRRPRRDHRGPGRPARGDPPPSGPPPTPSARA
ncbi:hypothetical protein Sdagh_65680 [Streptomyces daghestanicus]|uniref:PA14 domain-containing protein n=1 Tax=Streptomyces daghestanicus TaxID=66885 RepID=A0ABQ3QC28_9ACTN|nr:hypothetical protein Sdagh_65680 [Streptomyces daghestanicus]